MSTTIVIWAQAPDAAVIFQISQQAEAYVVAGKTDGNFDQQSVPQGIQVSRNWVTPEDAQLWIDFVTRFNPVSAQIVV